MGNAVYSGRLLAGSWRDEWTVYCVVVVSVKFFPLQMHSLRQLVRVLALHHGASHAGL